MTPLLAVVTAVLLLLGVFAVRRGVPSADLLPPLTLAITTALILFNKVGSPQFVTWLAVPIVFGLTVSLTGRGPSFRVPVVLSLVIAGLTQAIYPYLYSQLLSASPTSRCCSFCRRATCSTSCCSSGRSRRSSRRIAPRSGARPVTALTPARTRLALLALALGGFGIGATEFVAMGLLPDIARDLLARAVRGITRGRARSDRRDDRGLRRRRRRRRADDRGARRAIPAARAARRAGRRVHGRHRRLRARPDVRARRRRTLRRRASRTARTSASPPWSRRA